MTAEARGRAPAKVNLALAVLGRRHDGFHEIDTVLQELALADVVAVGEGSTGGVTVTGPWAAGTPADETNLAWRAAAALARRVGREHRGLRIAIEKLIPPAGGLGGGASDAAAVLRLLGERWGAPPDAVAAAAAEVGSDEPYFLVGGTARARGRGEIVTPLPAIPPRAVILFVPPETLERKTARLFEALGALPFDAPGTVESFVTAGLPTLSPADLFNAFERVAFDVFPGLGALRREIEGEIGGPVRLAGAGPTLFWIGDERAAAIIERAAGSLPCTVIRTSTPG